MQKGGKMKLSIFIISVDSYIAYLLITVGAMLIYSIFSQAMKELARRLGRTFWTSRLLWGFAIITILLGVAILANSMFVVLIASIPIVVLIAWSLFRMDKNEQKTD